MTSLRFNACAALVAFGFVAAVIAAPKPRPTVAIPPPTDPSATQATSRPSWPPIPRDTLMQIYRTELGDKFRPDFDDRYLRAQELIEKYFETAGSAPRKAIAGELEETGLPADVIGRLCRVRMYWPQLEGGGVYYVNEKTGVFPTRYFFGVPAKYDRTKSWPLVIKLPTAHAFLGEPPPDAQQVTDIYTKWIKEESAAHPDAVVVMPLLNLSELWGPSYAGMNGAMLPMQHVANRVNIDPARVYLVGHSMSAHATWNLALHYPTYFAAINPLAGGASDTWQRIRIINLRNVLPVAWHDADDKVIKVTETRGLVTALKTQKVDVEYEETKGIGHAPTPAIAERLYEKMRARVRQLYPPVVSLQSNRPDTMFNRNDWLQVYQPIDTGKEHKALWQHGSGTMTYTDKTWRIEGAIKGQRIEITNDNVDSFRIYLNDQMVNLKDPITVIVNKRPRLEGVVRPSIEEMMKDQAFLGRGWRYYTAVLDVDMILHPPPPTRPSTKPATVPATKTAPKK
jgi:pimeloyl-ACP methyl ester carboxylesterase